MDAQHVPADELLLAHLASVADVLVDLSDVIGECLLDRVRFVTLGAFEGTSLGVRVAQQVMLHLNLDQNSTNWTLLRGC